VTWNGAERNRQTALKRTAGKENEKEKMSNQALHQSMRRLRCRLISQQTERIPRQPYRPRDPAKASRRHLGRTGCEALRRGGSSDCQGPLSLQMGLRYQDDRND
jgi:hypothetical protein